MKASERKQQKRRQQLRCVQRKLDQCQSPAEKYDDQEAWPDLVERRIQEAMAAGDFENLAGKGKPLTLTRNPYLDPSIELAYGLLQNSGYVPEWIARDKEIRETLEAMRARLRVAWVERQEQAGDEVRWRTAIARFEQSLDQLNRKIDDYNLVVPILRCQRARIRLEEEISRLKNE